MKLLCFGDLQLGLHGRIDDQRSALEQIATLAFEHDVDVVLDGGDTFEGPTITPDQLELFARFVAACRACDIPVVATSGNGRHDAALRETNGLAIFDHIDGVHVGVTPRVITVPGLHVATLPWVHPKRLVARIGGQMSRAEIEQQLPPLLIDIAADLREQCSRLDAGMPAVLLTHFDISGASVPSGLPVDAVSNVVLPVDELAALGFDAVIASHIHRPQLLIASPPVLYTGSPLAHDFSEGDFDHGCWLLDIGGDRSVRAEFVPLAHRRLITLDFDHDDVVAQIALSSSIGWSIPDGALVRVRVYTTGEQWRHVDVPSLRRELAEAGASAVRVEPQIVREQRARLAGVDEQLDELAALDLWLQANAIIDDTARAMRAKTRDYLEVVA